MLFFIKKIPKEDKKKVMIFLFLKKETAKTHYINARFNIPNNAPVAVCEAALVGN